MLVNSRAATQRGMKLDLTNISLRWMIDQCTTSGAGILFDPRKQPQVLGIENSTILLNERISRHEFAPMVITSVQQLISKSKGSDPALQNTSKRLTRNLSKPTNTVSLKELFGPFLKSFESSKAQKPSVEGKKKVGSTSSDTGRSKWEANSDFRDVLSSKITGPCITPK